MKFLNFGTVLTIYMLNISFGAVGAGAASRCGAGFGSTKNYAQPCGSGSSTLAE
jgi:hypothetical protein